MRTGFAGRDGRYPVRPDYEFFDLADAAEFITAAWPALLERARAALPRVSPGSLIAVGGLGRSGKSTWATLLREVLAERGMRGQVVPLDSWLRPADERGFGSVLERFDLAAVEREVHDQARHQADLYVAGLLAKASERPEMAGHVAGVTAAAEGPLRAVEKKGAPWWSAFWAGWRSR